jgi:hypothetical protein
MNGCALPGSQYGTAGSRGIDLHGWLFIGDVGLSLYEPCQVARCCRDRSYKKEELQAFVLFIAIVCPDFIKSYAIEPKRPKESYWGPAPSSLATWSITRTTKTT